MAKSTKLSASQTLEKIVTVGLVAGIVIGGAIEIYGLATHNYSLNRTGFSTAVISGFIGSIAKIGIRHLVYNYSSYRE